MTANPPSIHGVQADQAASLAVLPSPVIDTAEFMACYERACEAASQLRKPLATHARLIRWAVAHGVIDADRTNGITDDRAGASCAITLGQNISRQIVSDAMARAQQWCREASLSVPDDTDMCLFAEISVVGDGLALQITHDCNCRLADVSSLFDALDDRALVGLAQMALDAVTRISVLAVDAPLYRLEDETQILYHLCDGMFFETFEDWLRGGLPPREEAESEALAIAESEGMEPGEAKAMFDSLWQRLQSLLDDRARPKDAPDTPQALEAHVHALRADGHSHRLLDYASGVAALWRSSQTHAAERGHEPQVECDMSHRMFMTAHTRDEFDYCAAMASDLMNCGEAPSLTFEHIDEMPYDALVDELACCYVQALAFESLTAYQLLDAVEAGEHADV